MMKSQNVLKIGIALGLLGLFSCSPAPEGQYSPLAVNAAAKIEPAPIETREANLTPSLEQESRPEFPVQFSNVRAKTDSENRQMSVQFDVDLGKSKLTDLMLIGTLDQQGIAQLSHPNIQGSHPLKALARCIDECKTIIVDFIVKYNGNIKREQHISHQESQPDNSQEESIDIIGPTKSAEYEEGDDSNVKMGEYVSPPLTVDFVSDLDDLSRDGFVKPEPVQQHKSPHIDSTLADLPIPAVPVPQNSTDAQSAGPDLEDQKVTIEFQDDGKTEPIIQDNATTSLPYDLTLLGPAYSGKAKGFYSGAKGRSKGGRLEYDQSIEPEGVGFKSIDRSDDIHYASGLTLRAIHLSGLHVDDVKEGFQFTVNDIAKKGGGKAHGHKSHQNGLDIDIPFDSLDNPEPYLEMLKKMNDLKGPRDESILLRVFLDRNVKQKKLCDWAKKNGKLDRYKDVLSRIDHWPNHRTHFHVRLNCTWHNPSCIQEDYTPSASSGCR